ncbi:MAG: FecR family protein [Chitinophagaceae bacterium]
MPDLKMKEEEIIQLTRKYLDGGASPQEMEFLEKYYQYFDREPGIADHFSTDEKAKLEKEMLATVWKKIDSPAIVVPLYKRTWFRIAALFVLIAGAAFIFLNRKTEQQPIAKQQQVVPEIVPGGNKAILTLADNSLVVLDNAANGDVAQQGNVKLVKLDGQLAYNGTGGSPDILYNTISTPRGGQYQLVLSDGTKVWLNASSSLRFPASFPAKERKVEITGEAYFEVAHNTSKPFRVNVAGKGMVEVLGTHFNINSYDDESSSKITLLEGLVKVIKNNTVHFLKPGQQAQVTDKVMIVNGANIEEVVAWKNGKFLFDKTDVQTTMRQLARWYDVEISYDENVNGFFNGTISRNENISKTLKMLQMTGEVHFNVEGRKIVVKR